MTTATPNPEVLTPPVSVYLQLEGVAVVQFLSSSFGEYLSVLFAGILTAPSQENFFLLAQGWSMARGRFFVTTFIWLSGAARRKHFSTFYYFLGQPFYKARYEFWACIIKAGAKLIPEDQPIRILVDESTRKKSGRKIEGVSRYRNGAGTARQEYRTLCGLNFVYATMLVSCPLFGDLTISVPIGIELYLKKKDAKELKQASATRSALARKIVDFACEQLPEREIRSVADGGYSTKEYLQKRPQNLDAVGRMNISGKLYETPPSVRPKGKRGRTPKKGKLIGSPKTLILKRKGWKPHPSEKGAKIQSWDGIWHSVLPGERINVAVIYRPELPKNSKKKKVEAFFTTDLSLNEEEILKEAKSRWAIEIDIRDGNEFYGVGKNQCRKYTRIVGANTLCLVLAAARSLWFLKLADQADSINLRRFRPWYSQKCKPSQLDIAWACLESLTADGISSTFRFWQDLSEIHEPKDGDQRTAAQDGESRHRATG